MQVSVFFRLAFGLVLLSGSLSVVSCKTEDVRPRGSRSCERPTPPAGSDTTKTQGVG